MATKSQIQANQANASRSTGPRTPQGKAKSSQNALKHGLRAEATILPGENLDDFDLLVSELEDEFQPAGAIEWTLLRQLADAEWRMRRVPMIEAAVLAKELRQMHGHYDSRPHLLPESAAEIEIFLIGAAAGNDAVNGDVLAKMSRYESRLSHRYFKALAHLRALQDRRLSPAGDADGAHQRRPAPAGDPVPSPQNGRTNPIPAPARPLGDPQPTGQPASDLTFASPGRPFPNAHSGLPLPAPPSSARGVATPPGRTRCLCHAHLRSQPASHPRARRNSTPRARRSSNPRAQRTSHPNARRNSQLHAPGNSQLRSQSHSPHNSHLDSRLAAVRQSHASPKR